MIIEKLKKEDFNRLQYLFDSKSAIEILFSDLGKLTEFEKGKFSHVRLYQLPYLSYEYLIAEDKTKNEVENHKKRVGAGTCYALGGRLNGKSLCLSKLDVPFSMILYRGLWGAFASYDASHIRGILEPVAQILEDHPFFKLFKTEVTRPNGGYELKNKLGNLINTVNENILGKKIGGTWFGLHIHKMWGEEFSFTNDEASRKRLMSKSERGSPIERINGMCLEKGTKILMQDFQTKNIEDVRAGDKVIGWSEQHKKFSITEVKKSAYMGKKDVIEITADNYSLNCTPEHRLFFLNNGTNKYGYFPAINCSLFNYNVSTIPFFEKDLDIYKGILIGLLDSDGGHIVIKEKYHQFSIYQSNVCEFDFIKYLLDKLNIKNTISELKSGFGGTNKYYKFSIMREHNYLIFDSYNKLTEIKNIGIGYIIGFIIGDGSVREKIKRIEIYQSLKNIDKINKIKKVLDYLKINYSCEAIKKGEHVQFNIAKFDFPFYIENSIKSDKYKKILLSLQNQKAQIFWSKRVPKLSGFKKDIDVYDLETGTHSFIANGFIVHNCIFNKHSPMGRIFFNIKLKNWVINLPAFINPKWSTKDDEDAVREFGGNRNSLGYRTQINGEVIEDQDSAFDIELVRRNYNYKKIIKSFDITKKNLYRFKQDLVVERPNNADEVELGMDVGEGSTPSEICVIIKNGDKYQYIYNISLYQLTDEQEYDILMFLYEKLNYKTLAIDCTSGKGKALYWRLEKKLQKGILVWVGFNEKIKVKFDKDENGEIKTDSKGNLQYTEEFISVWSVQRLKNFFYNFLLEMPIDEKFDKEINNFVCFISGNRETYDSKINQDHLVAAFRCWAIGNWVNEFNPSSGEESKFFKGFVY